MSKCEERKSLPNVKVFAAKLRRAEPCLAGKQDGKQNR